MIGRSNDAGKPIQTSAQTPDAEALRIECIRYMLNEQAAFGHEEIQSFPISLGLNNKGGMDDDNFFEYLQKSIMKLYPRIPNEDGSRWLIVDHGIQVSMPGILEPHPNQSYELVRRGQFKEGDDPDACKNVQHWNT